MLLVGGLALVEQSPSLVLQPVDLLLQPALLLVQIPDGRLVGHLGGLQGADLTWGGQSNEKSSVGIITASLAVSFT